MKNRFEKSILIVDQKYGDIPTYIEMIARLFYCMKETNELHDLDNEYFRIEFCPSYEYMGMNELKLKWGKKKREAKRHNGK